MFLLLQVIKPNLAIEKVSYFERDNLWIGPRQADLIHMGAKYSPCMRKDANVERLLADARSTESRTACCVRNDGSGCLQTVKDECSVGEQHRQLVLAGVYTGLGNAATCYGCGHVAKHQEHFQSQLLQLFSFPGK